MSGIVIAKYYQKFLLIEQDIRYTGVEAFEK